MNVVQASPKQQILALLRQMTISEELFNAFNEKIEKKLAERVLLAREVDLQPELNRISELYRKAITEHQANLKKQYDLGRDTFQKIEATEEDLLKIMPILQAFQAAIAPVLEVHMQLEGEVQDLEGQIISLLPMGTQFV